jgi:uncharacterized protein
MKRLLTILALFFAVSVSAQVEKAIPARPSPPKLVNDFTGKFITHAQAQALEHKLVVYDDSTSNQIAIVIVESLQGYEANEYATALGRKWGVGNKEFNNGIVILISTGGGDGNRDAYIATGYGLEGAVPDVIANRILDNELIPNFKEENYYRGLDNTTDALIKAIAGEYKAPAKYGNRKKEDGFKIWMVIAIIIFILFSAFFGGGRGGTYVSRGGYGGWSGGGWSGGSSSSSGGFGGFGGGSFGGGGAGGKW